MPGSKSDVKVHVAVLPQRLWIVQCAKEEMKFISYYIMKFFLISSEEKQSRFFSMTITKDEVSFIIDEETLQEFPLPDESQSILKSVIPSAQFCTDESAKKAGELAKLQVCNVRWCGIQIFQGTLGITSTGIVHALATPLAQKNISIFNLSTYETDYVLVPENRIYDALEAIKGEFHILTEGVEELEKSFPRSSNTSPVETPVASKPTLHHLFPSDADFRLCGIKKDELLGHSASLLSLIFFPPQPATFISFTETEDEVSLVLDKAILDSFSDLLYSDCGESWRLLKVGDAPLGFTETGIVSSLAECISGSNINLFYVSTFSNDYVMVPTADFAKASTKLKSFSKRFSVHM